jgi:leader peptidase (prepilin peptidase)/N-methyltransferase
VNASILIVSFLATFASASILEIISAKFWEPRWAERNIAYCNKSWYRWTRIVFSGMFGLLFSLLYGMPLTGVAFVGFAWLVLTVIDTDLKSKKIPREPCWIVFFLSTIVALLTIYSIENAVYGIGSLIIFGGAFFAVAMITRGGLGSGDVRLIVALSPMGWWFGFYPIILGLGVAFVVQLTAHIILFFVKREKGKKRYLPFGPALGVGLLLSQLWFGLFPESAFL